MVLVFHSLNNLCMNTIHNTYHVGRGGGNMLFLSLLLHDITQPLTSSLLLKGEWEVRG